eukprot:6454703-Prymnesium_polylepis.1
MRVMSGRWCLCGSCVVKVAGGPSRTPATVSGLAELQKRRTASFCLPPVTTGALAVAAVATTVATTAAATVTGGPLALEAPLPRTAAPPSVRDVAVVRTPIMRHNVETPVARDQ